ncbi:SnoaL-like polyketide cyclase [Geotalea daltonii FRC-32]|uniref:SnoaL-like polyketide cyclase n=1 Tax=Geotalea daltonii (strain DSM 22248 / JCM 15807 / FRC-32) TaxID=316067 RepID=B9M2F6_GEODF|nr:ester cyclase [Geotalea daltonii]ACM19335.1 SnoaL-like polyketide cyclase [Geotalea daltonii FRC-32]
MKAIKATLLVAGLFFIMGGTAIAKEKDVNKALIGRFAEEVFVKKDLSEVERYVRADYIQHNPLVKQGSAGFKEFFAAWFAAVPDWNYSLKKIVAEGDEVWVYGTYSGTLEKEWLGIPGNGQKYSFDAVDIFRVQDGKLAEHWDVMDIYGLFRQLGVIK